MNHFLSYLVEKNIRAEKWVAPFSLPKFQAHRGYHVEGAQENTIDAFREAHKKGATMFECDVQLSKDKIPVVFHDSDLKRLAGLEAKVNELTAAELYRKVKAPALTTVLLVKDIPKFINIELKTKGTWNESLERRVCDLLKEMKCETRVMFSSFNPVSLWKVASYAPRIPRALLVSSDPSEDNRIYLRKMWAAPLLSIHSLNLDEALITEPILQIFKSNGVPIVAWTVNDPKKAKALFAKGVISIISDQLFES